MSNYLADRRKELGVTQKEVADFVGVSEATVSRWESGAIANMRRDRINLYAKILQVRPSFIMTGENAPAPPTTCPPGLTPTEWTRVRKIRRADDHDVLVIDTILSKYPL